MDKPPERQPHIRESEGQPLSRRGVCRGEMAVAKRRDDERYRPSHGSPRITSERISARHGTKPGDYDGPGGSPSDPRDLRNARVVPGEGWYPRVCSGKTEESWEPASGDGGQGRSIVVRLSYHDHENFHQRPGCITAGD